jgi:hypothetical protein
MPVRFGRILSTLLAGAFAFGLAGCEVVEPPGRPPAERPEPPPPTPPSQPEPEVEAPKAAPPPPSEESQLLRDYYRRLQADLLSQGLLRGDGGGPDTPFTDTMLARDFVAIALFDESVPSTGEPLTEAREARLRRWDQPIRIETVFGASVPEDQEIRDVASVRSYASRLSTLTGVPISVNDASAGPANFHVLFLSEDDREAFEPRLRDLIPNIAPSSVRAFMNLPKAELCLAIALAVGQSSSYDQVVVLIRAEHPELLRSNCIHEELAQAMGLANDSRQARPSIFNDDQEFALLTRHDELLLRILYDPRLRTGMTIEEATPIVQQIAGELAGGPV